VRVLVLLHGMPPLSNCVVVGTGLRAFANGEGLRMRGHEVFYCTRREDLPEASRGKGQSKKNKTITQVKGANHPPGDLQRITNPLESALISRAGGPLGPALLGRAPTPASTGKKDHSGLATVGGELGSAGNPLAFTDTHELHDVVRYVDPDVVLVEAPEEVRRLPPGTFRVILDLFAPRMLEQQFQEGAEERESVRVLDALQLSDAFLFSNERQKYYHLPLLTLAGIDCTETGGVVVPIASPPQQPNFSKPKSPVFVAGGVFWPWADLGPGLAELHACLAKAGEGTIHLYGGEYGIRSDTLSYADPRERLPKKSKHLKFKGMVAIDTLWKQYSQASVAFDLMTPNPERELNLSFRQLDYLRCGLPIITSPRQVIADQLLAYGAGWCIDPGDNKALRALVKDLLAHPEKIARASSAAQKLAHELFTWEVSTEGLDKLIRSVKKREHTETFVNRLARTQGDLWQEHEENKRLRETVLHLQDDQGKKSEEIQSLNSRLGVLLSSVDRLSGSITAVSRFKNDMLLFLHEAEDAALREAAELTTEVERLQLDIKKKDAAIKAGKREQTKAAKALSKQEERFRAELENKDDEIAAAAKDLAKQELRFSNELEKKDQETANLGLSIQKEQDGAGRALARQEESFQAAMEKKDQDIARRGEERAILQKRLDQSLDQSLQQTDQLAAARVDISDLDGRINLAGNQVETFRLEVERLKDRLQQSRFEHKKLLQELDKKEREVNKAQKTRDRTKAKLEAAVAKLEERLSKAEFLHRNLLEEGAKKDVEVVAAQAERDAMKAGLEASVSSLEERLAKAEFLHRNLLEEGAKKNVEVKAAQVERDTMKAGLEASVSGLEERMAQGEFEYRTLVEDTAKKDGEIQEIMAERDNIKARLDGDIDSLKARLTRLDYEHRTLLEQFAKKEGEFEQVQRAHKRLTTENEQLNVKVGSLDGRLEESLFQIKVLDAEIEKKNDEIADAQSRRDALAEALQEERAQHARGGVLLRRKLKSEFLGKN